MYIILPIIIIVIIVGIAFGASNFKNIDFASADSNIDLRSFFFPSRERTADETAPTLTAPQPKRQRPVIQQPTIQHSGSLLLDTTITHGPPEGFTLTGLTTITFGFSGSASPQSAQPISYETKIEGFDLNWQPTASNSRTVTLPLEAKQYTFFVRARLGNNFDPTPAQRSFNIAAY